MAPYTVNLDRDAVEDLRSIYAWVLAERGAALATTLSDRILAHCAGFTRFPYRGRARSDIRPNLRIVGWRRTVTIAFRVDEPSKTVVILGVFLKGRDVATALSARPGQP